MSPCPQVSTRGRACAARFAWAAAALPALGLSCDQDAPPPPSASVATATETAAKVAPPVASPTAPPKPPRQPARVEIRKVQLFPDSKDSKVLHVVAEVHNLGPGVAVGPRAKVALKSKGGGLAVDQAVCAPHVEFLLPGQAAPCEAAFSRGMDWADFSVEPDSYPVDATAELVPLTVAHGAYQRPEGLFSPHKVKAEVTNGSAHPAADAWAMVGLYAADGRLVGVGASHIAGGEIGAGVTADVTVDVYEVAAQVERFELIAVGYKH